MRVKSLLIPGLAALVVLVAALSLGKSRASTSGVAQSSTIVRGHKTSDLIKNYAFAPVSLTVKVGTRVRWTNRDSTAHTATADGGSFDTGTINPGKSNTIDFKHPGTYVYHCAFHAFMTATIKVVG